MVDKHDKHDKHHKHGKGNEEKHGPHVNKYADKVEKRSAIGKDPQKSVIEAISQHQKKGDFEAHKNKAMASKHQYDIKEAQKHKDDFKRDGNKNR